MKEPERERHIHKHMLLPHAASTGFACRCTQALAPSRQLMLIMFARLPRFPACSQQQQLSRNIGHGGGLACRRRATAAGVQPSTSHQRSIDYSCLLNEIRAYICLLAKKKPPTAFSTYGKHIAVVWIHTQTHQATGSMSFDFSIILSALQVHTTVPSEGVSF